MALIDFKTQQHQKDEIDNWGMGGIEKEREDSHKEGDRGGVCSKSI